MRRLSEKKVRRKFMEIEPIQPEGPLNTLPTDLLGVISDYLNFHSVFLLQLTSKHFAQQLRQFNALKSQYKIVTENAVTLIIKRDRLLFEYTEASDQVPPIPFNLKLDPGDSIEAVYIYTKYPNVAVRYVFVQTVQKRFYLSPHAFAIGMNSYDLEEVAFRRPPKKPCLKMPFLGDNFILLQDNDNNMYSLGSFITYSKHFVNRRKIEKSVLASEKGSFVLLRSEDRKKLCVYGKGVNYAINPSSNKPNSLTYLDFPLAENELIAYAQISQWSSCFITNQNRVYVSSWYIDTKQPFSYISLTLKKDEQIKKTVLFDKFLYLLTNQNRILYCGNVAKAFAEVNIPLNPDEYIHDISALNSSRFTDHSSYVATTHNRLFKLTKRNVEPLQLNNIQAIFFNNNIMVIDKKNHLSIVNLSITNLMLPLSITPRDIKEIHTLDNRQTTTYRALTIIIMTKKNELMILYYNNNNQNNRLPFLSKKMIDINIDPLASIANVISSKEGDEPKTKRRRTDTQTRMDIEESSISLLTRGFFIRPNQPKRRDEDKHELETRL